MLFDFIKRYWQLRGVMHFFPWGGGASARFALPASVRYRAGAGAYSHWTPASSGNRRKWTWHGWVKRARTGSGSYEALFSAGGSSNNRMALTVGDGGGGLDDLQFYMRNGGGVVWRLYTSALFRDPGAWLPVTVHYDSDNATAADRAIIFVGLDRCAVTTATAVPINTDSWINDSASVHEMGRWAGGSYFDGLEGRSCLIDGQLIPPSAFLERNSDGVLVPRSTAAIRAAVALGGGARNGWGTNGNLRLFNDTTSATTLGYDRSQSDTDTSGNNWTAVNISTAADVTCDVFGDTPTNNFATLNSIEIKGASETIVDANLKTTAGAADGFSGWSSIGMRAGKYVAEFTAGASADYVGIATSTVTKTASPASAGSDLVMYASSGSKVVNGATTAYGASYTSGDVIRIELDCDSGRVEFFKNEVSQGVITGLPSAKDWFFATATGGGSAVWNANFGQAPLNASAAWRSGAGGFFRGTPTTGFKALCTANLPVVAIPNPEIHADVIAVTKSGNTNFTIPWDADVHDTFFEIKSRGASGNWYQIDTLRGVDRYLSSNATTAETTDANVLGVSGTTGTLKATLADGTYVVTVRKAGLISARQTNTSGSITSTVSANTTAGFSIVTYTGTGANATVGHGLGAAPKMAIVKCRDPIAGAWGVHHVGLTSATYVVWLNATTAQTSSATHWNSTAPTSSVISIGTSADVNQSTKTYVAYCFAETPGHSKFGSLPGNNSADGPSVNCGFRPRWIMLKKVTGTTYDWAIYDTARSTSNVNSTILWASSAGAENSFGAPGDWKIDILSNGFKIRENTNYINTSGETTIFAAFAEHPFGGANVAPAPAR